MQFQDKKAQLIFINNAYKLRCRMENVKDAILKFATPPLYKQNTKKTVRFLSIEQTSSTESSENEPSELLTQSRTFALRDVDIIYRVFIPDKHHFTPRETILWALFFSNYDYAAVLLTLYGGQLRAEEINCRFDDGRTLLHYAFIQSNGIEADIVVDVIRHLYNRGAEFDIADEENHYPIDYLTLAIGDRLFNNVLFFQDLPLEILQEHSSLALDEFCVYWGYNGFDEIRELINQANAGGHIVKILPKKYLSLLGVIISFLDSINNQKLTPEDIINEIQQSLNQRGLVYEIPTEYLDLLNNNNFILTDFWLHYLCELNDFSITIITESTNVITRQFNNRDGFIQHLSLLELNDDLYLEVINFVEDDISSDIEDIPDESNNRAEPVVPEVPRPLSFSHLFDGSEIPFNGGWITLNENGEAVSLNEEDISTSLQVNNIVWIEDEYSALTNQSSLQNDNEILSFGQEITPSVLFGISVSANNDGYIY